MKKVVEFYVTKESLAEFKKDVEESDEELPHDATKERTETNTEKVIFSIEYED